MSFIKSKHSGWTHELKRTPFGGGGGDPFSAISDTISSGFSDIGLGGSVQPIVAPVVDAGLALSGNPEFIPAFNAANTLAQTGDVGQAALSGGTAYLGGQIGGGLSDLMGGGTPFELPDGTMGSIQGGNILDSAGNIVAEGGGGTSLGDILKTAQSGVGIVGGLAKMAGGVGSVLAGQQAGQYAKQADPFAQYRSGYAAQLSNLLSNPQTVTSTPGYQFNLAQGLQAQQAQQAAQGRLVSGGALLQGQQFGQQLAGQTYQQQLQNLAQLSGASQSPATGATAQAGLTAGQLGGVLGGAQAIAGGLGSVINPLQTLYAQYNQSSPSVQ
jgi:hypothetical protein